MTDRTMLQFDYEEVSGRTVKGVLGYKDEPAGWACIAILVAERAVVLRVDPDTDELIVTLEDAPDLMSGWVEVVEITHVIGSALGWCWIGRNYLGYLDMFALSFSGIEPQVCFLGEACTLTIRHISADR